MGLVNENLLTKGFSGKVGDEIVFRQVKTRTGEMRTQVSNVRESERCFLQKK